MTLNKTLRWLCALAAAPVCATCSAKADSPTTASAAALAATTPSATCANLTAVGFTGIGGVGSAVASATETTSTIDGAPVRFCTVEGTLAPSVGFRVRLAVESQSRRFIHMGCGGLCGSIGAAVEPGQAYHCPLTQQGGAVLASTDMGHSGNAGDWTLDAQKRVDFAYRGVHVTTTA